MQTEMKNDDAIKSGGRASPLTPASRIPRWMYQLMCERGSNQPRNRSRSHARTASDHLGERPRPAEQHDSPAVHSETSIPTQMGSALTVCGDSSRPAAVEANADCNSCDTAVLAPPPPSCAPPDDSLPSPQPLADPHQTHHRTTYRDSYGDFSSASSNASSSTSYSGGFDSSRSASSVTSASSAMTFSAATAGWTGQTGSPSSAPSPSFGGRKRSPAAASSEAESSGKVPPRSHVVVVDDDPEVTLCLSRLHLPSSSELQILAPDEADTTPLASTSRLASEPITAATAAPSPPSPTTTATSHLSLETTATHPSPIAPIPLVDDGTLLAPENFATVSTDLYRSSFPRKQHFPFLKNLGLKSVMCVGGLRAFDRPPRTDADLTHFDSQGPRARAVSGGERRIPGKGGNSVSSRAHAYSFCPRRTPADPWSLSRLFQYGIPGNKEPFVSSESFSSP